MELKDKLFIAEFTVDKLKQQNTELLKQNEALVGCIKDLIMLNDLGHNAGQFERAEELLNTLNK